MKIFDLYFDESGNFEEYTLLDDSSVLSNKLPQLGASQLVGILATSGYINTEIAENILCLAHERASLDLGLQCHATELIHSGNHAAYSTLLNELFRQVELSRIQPIRFCNNVRIGFGDKVTTYTSMVAEMVVRVFEELTRINGNDKIEMNIIAARVRTNGQDKAAQPIFIEEIEYRRRLDEQITFTAVRRGVAHNRINWKISGFRFGSGLKERPLQVCDLLSNASYRNFRNCSSAQKKQLKLLFGGFDITLNRSEVLEEIDHNVQNGSLAHAVQIIAENWYRPELDQIVRQSIKEHCTTIVSKLAGMPVSTRNIHLRQLVDWCGQFLEVRDLDLTDSILKWMEKQVAAPLCEIVDNPIRRDVYWFLAQLLILRLGEHNHRGELSLARPICDRLQELFPALSGQWEHTPILTESMTLWAVHLNDCYEYDEASRLMGAVEGFYGGLSSLMSDALPGLFPERVRSKHRGMALGTKLQSEMFAGLADPVRFDIARRLNEMAVDEFSSENDKRRQFQYRCQIETLAGNIADAKIWLAKSLNIKTNTHGALAETIKSLDGFEQGFALLHWSRIGMEAGRQGFEDDLHQYMEAFSCFKLDLLPWVKQKVQEYPAHGIRRHLAIAFAHAGMVKSSQETINSLRQLDSIKRETLELIKLVGCAEVAALWGNDNSNVIKKLFQESSAKHKPLLADLKQFVLATESFPSINRIASNLLSAYNTSVASDWNNNSEIFSVCRLVGQ